MVNLGLDISQIIFEKGLEVRRENSDWLSTSNCRQPIQVDPIQITETHNLRPIVLTLELSPAHSHPFLAPTSKGRLLEIEMADLTQIAPFQNRRFVMWNLDLSYTVGAVIHHCHLLAQAYVDICRNFSRFPSPNGKVRSPCVFGNQPEPYYAFEALINAAMRFYMTARRPIWAAFGCGGPVPNSFEKTMDRCTKLPNALGQQLKRSWDVCGEKLKEYRDCIEHYVKLGDHIPFAFMELLDDQLWTAWLRIPDNPQARSGKAFRYDSKLDALTYGWTVTDEVVKLAHALIKQLPND